MVRFVLLFSVLFYPSLWAEKISRSSLCAAHLGVLANYTLGGHEGNSPQNTSTHDAFRLARQFRFYNLGIGQVKKASWSQWNVDESSASSRQQKGVAARIRGVELDYNKKVPTQPQKSDPKQAYETIDEEMLVMGVQLTGSNLIADHLSTLRNNAIMINDIMSKHPIWLTHLRWVTTSFASNTLFLPWSAYNQNWPLALLFMLSGPILSLDYLIHKLWPGANVDINRTMPSGDDVTKLFETNSWFYRSNNFRLRLPLVEDLLKGNDTPNSEDFLHSLATQRTHDLSRLITWLGHYYHLYKAQKWSGHKYLSTCYVLHDRLGYIAEQNEPVLVDLIRVSRKRPVYPARTAEPAHVPQLSPVLQATHQ